MFHIFSHDSFEYKSDIKSMVYLFIILILAKNKRQALAAINTNLSETIPATTTHGEDMTKAGCFYFWENKL